MLEMLIYKTQTEMLNSNWISNYSWEKIRLHKKSKEKGAEENPRTINLFTGEK